MALTWNDLNLISDNLVEYFFGTQLALAIGVLSFFYTVMIGSGIDFRVATVSMLPLLAGYTIGGVFGANVWILHVAIIIVGFIYTSALIKIVS